VRTHIDTLCDLTPDPLNANRGTPRGRTLLEASLRTYGAGRSILADRAGRIIAGNKTLERATALALPVRVVDSRGTELIVVRRTDLDLTVDPRARELAIADNRIAELDLDWDPAILKQHLADGVPLSTWWTDHELERLLQEGIHPPGLTDENATVTPRQTTIKSGDLFRLGAHRVLCGDATSPTDVARLLAGAEPRLLVTDPPYGVSYDPAWRHRRYPGQRTAVGAVTHDEEADWGPAFDLFRGDVAYVWHAGVHAGTVAAAVQRAGLAIRSQIIWAKQHL
jgi:hypothetical protein